MPNGPARSCRPKRSGNTPDCVPLLKVTRGVPCDEPVIPFARKRTGLLARELDAFALPLRTDGVNARGDLGVPLAKFLLSCVRSDAGMSEELGFETRLMQPPVLVPDIIRETFTRDIVAVPVLA